MSVCVLNITSIANLHRTVPTYLNPYMYKMDNEGEILLHRGDEYYNDNIPYDGVYIHFAKQIMEVSCRRIELYVVYRIIVNCFYSTAYLLLNQCIIYKNRYPKETYKV